jgi:hypothetical protein
MTASDQRAGRNFGRTNSSLSGSNTTSSGRSQRSAAKHLHAFLEPHDRYDVRQVGDER